jgi:hypothetical protein
MHMGGHSRRVLLSIGALVLIAGLSALWPAYRAFLDIEIDYCEGWNAYHADAAMGRMPLYPARDQLITNNYPPLSFYIVGGLGWLIDDNILAGRLLSLAAIAAIAVGVALATRRLGGSPMAASVGAVYFVATMCRFFTGYVGMNDPSLLARAVMTAGFVAFLGARQRDSGYTAPLLLMVAAGFIKHNIIAMPLTAIIWLALNRPRQMVKSGIVAGMAVAAGFGLCFAVFGADFFENLTSPRVFLWRQAFDSVGHLQWVAVGMAAWLYVGVTRRGDPDVRLCSLLIGVGLFAFLIQKTGVGVASNAQFDLVFGVSIGVGLAFTQAPLLPLARRFSPDALRFAFLIAICVRLAASARIEPVRLLIDPSFHAEIAAREAAMSATIARIKTAPGDVDCCLYACYRAKKPFFVDPFNCHQRMKAGKLPPDAISKLIANGKLHVVEEDPPLKWDAAITSGHPSR